MRSSRQHNVSLSIAEIVARTGFDATCESRGSVTSCRRHRYDRQMADQQLQKGDRVKLDDGREGEIIDFDGRTIGKSGGVGGSARILLDDGTTVDAGPARITKL
jgi:hypothetical protein